MTRQEIKNQFDAGLITWQQALELLKKATKPWQTSQWKNRRAEILGECCQTCGSREPPLVIQHRWHPRDFADLCEAVKPAFREEYAVRHPFVAPSVLSFDPLSVPPPLMEERDCCPTCRSVAIKHRKRTNDWVCNGKVHYRICGYVFAEPLKRLWSRWTHEELIEMERRRHERLIPQAEREWESHFVQAYADRICHEATRLSFVEHDRYMEMRDSDVVTLCKKCSFKEDAIYADYPGKFGKQMGLSAEMIRRWKELKGVASQ